MMRTSRSGAPHTYPRDSNTSSQYKAPHKRPLKSREEQPAPILNQKRIMAPGRIKSQRAGHRPCSFFVPDLHTGAIEIIRVT
jgi:hypothetical protein